MLALACPKCGAPCRIPLAEQPVLACHHCQHRSEIAPAVADRVRAAFRALSNVADRERQFSGLRRTVASSASASVLAYLVLVVVIAVLSFAITRAYQGGPSIFYRVPRPNVLPGMAAVLTFVLSVPVLVGLLRAGRKLRGIARALPPLRAGEPCGCRVCGAAVAGVGIVRCTYCSSDNVVDREATVRSDEAHRSDAEGLEEEVRSAASALGETRGFGVPLVASVALLPLPIFVLWFGPAFTALIELSASEDMRFALQERGPTPTREEARHEICVDLSETCSATDPGCVQLPPVAPSWLAGKTTTEGQRITGVYDNLYDGLVVRLESGKRITLRSTCVTGEPTEAWKAHRAKLDEKAREDAIRHEKYKEDMKRLFPDGGPPPIPDIPIQPLPDSFFR